jgi:MarR family transcriptional regulator for hemolysin
MANFPIERDLAFLLGDTARLLRTRADHMARRIGLTRAQWAVLFRVERAEGLKQTELADILDVQPITLTRMIDRLCDNGMIERRNDPSDRRVKRLFLLPAARPVLEQFNLLTNELMADALAGVDRPVVEGLVKHLAAIKENLRHAIADRPDNNAELEEQTYA